MRLYSLRTSIIILILFGICVAVEIFYGPEEDPGGHAETVSVQQPY